MNWREPSEKYLVQTNCDGEVSASMKTPTEIIEMFGFMDCSGCEYEVFDVSEFGAAIRLEHTVSATPNYHIFASTTTGEVMFEGYSAEH